MKQRIVLLIVIGSILLSGCNLPQNSPPTFIPPLGITATPAQVSYNPVPTGTPTDIPRPTQTHSAVETKETSAEAPPSPTPDLPPTATLEPTATLPPTPSVELSPILYEAQAGDTLAVVATHFSVREKEIESPQPIPQVSFINPGQLLIIPQNFINTTSDKHLLPDSEFVFSPATNSSDFPQDVVSFVNRQGGYLSRYRGYLSTTEISGGEIVEQIAKNNSLNPYLLLAVLEYQSGWVTGSPSNLREQKYPLGYVSYKEDGLVNQLRWAVNQLSIGYYGWREGRLVEIHLTNTQPFNDQVTARIAPTLNAGTVALQYYFSQIYESDEWIQALDENQGVMAVYREMFGDPASRSHIYEPLFPADLTQPPLELPFQKGSLWTYTGGPHGAWEREGSMSAVDFAPTTFSGGCTRSYAYVTASAPGLVVRSENGVVTIDLDGDGKEQTGWVLLYLHIAEEGRIAPGTWVQTGDKLGHPSCEGGISTGTHVHLARKYNGEWMTANGPIPFVMSGWTVHSGRKAYQGTLTRGDEVVTASPYSAPGSRVWR